MATDEVNQPPPTMRAWTYSQVGIPSAVLHLSVDSPTPALTSPTDVLVRITHASLSPGGSIMIQLCPFIFRAKPAIPEVDFSGTLVAVGVEVPQARGLMPGDSVFGSVPVGPHLSAGVGTLAEYIVLPASCVLRKPDHMSLEQAAGLAVSGCAALMLVERARLKEGDRVLINGASGGVGTIVVQLVRQAIGPDGKIVAICSERNVETVRKLGADEVSPLAEREAFCVWRKNYLCSLDCKFEANVFPIGHRLQCALASSSVPRNQLLHCSFHRSD
jgi:reticulon-4-interacting protein 1, mitochondrial